LRKTIENKAFARRKLPQKRSKKKLTVSPEFEIFTSHTVTKLKNMRTKTLLLAVAALTAGVITSEAQNVYSQNVVGYVNVSLTNGLNLVANPLDLDGTGTNNTLYTSVGTNWPNLTKVIAFTGSGYNTSIYNAGSGVWSGTAGTTFAVQPGKGFFLSIPASATLPQTVTFVGNVLQGVHTNNLITGIQISSSQFPLGGDLDTNLYYVPASLDKYIPWVSSPQGYGTAHTYNAGSQTWNGGGTPQVAVGQAFFISAHAASAWTNQFNVQ
jgi:hypothetical protein